jgi:hypothetical protein
VAVAIAVVIGDVIAAAVARGHRQRAKVSFVGPAARVGRQHAGETFAVEVDPLVVVAVEAVGGVGRALRVEHLDLRVDRRPAIPQVERRHPPGAVPAVAVGGEAGLPGGDQE